MKYFFIIIFILIFIGAAVWLFKPKKSKDRQDQEKNTLILKYKTDNSVAKCLDQFKDTNGDNIFEYEFEKMHSEDRYIISFTAILRYYHPCSKSSFFIDFTESDGTTLITMTTMHRSDKIFSSAYLVEMDEFMMTKVNAVKV